MYTKGVAWCSGRAPKDWQTGDRSHKQERRQEVIFLFIRASRYLPSLEKNMPNFLKNDAFLPVTSKRCREIIGCKLEDTQCDFVLTIALQIKFSLPKSLRNCGDMPKMTTSNEHMDGFLMKRFGDCCQSTTLKATCYWLSSHSIPTQM